MSKILLDLWAKIENKPAEQIAELLYEKGEDGKLTENLREDALEVMLSWNAERVKKLREGAPNPKALEDKYKQGKKEALEALETSLREKFKVQADKKGLELIEEIIAANAKAPGDGLSEDQIKRHPAYLDLEKRFASKDAEIEARKTELEKEFARQSTIVKVKQMADSELSKLDVIYPEDQAIAANLRKIYLDQFEQYDFDTLEDGNLLVRKGDKRLEDAHGNPVTLDSLSKQIASSLFMLKKQEPKGSAGNKNEDTPKPGVYKFRDRADYERQVLEAKTSEERVKIAAAYQASEAGKN